MLTNKINQSKKCSYFYTLLIFDFCSFDKNSFAEELITEVDQISMNRIHSYLITVEIATCLWFLLLSELQLGLWSY